MLDAGTLVCSRSSSRKRVSSDWAMPSWCWVYSQDHSLHESGTSLACGWRADGPGSVRASLQTWSSIGPGQPTPLAQILTPAAGARHLSHLLRLVTVDLQPHRCRRHASPGHWRILVMKKKYSFNLETCTGRRRGC